MAKYVDGFVIPVQRRKLAAYKKVAAAAGKVWMGYGALEYRECFGDELAAKWGLPFTKLAKVKKGETVVFSWIVYKSKASRDAINKKVMTDKRMVKMMELMNTKPIFDHKRMSFGGFTVAVSL